MRSGTNSSIVFSFGSNPDSLRYTVNSVPLRERILMRRVLIRILSVAQIVCLVATQAPAFELLSPYARCTRDSESSNAQAIVQWTPLSSHIARGQHWVVQQYHRVTG